MTAIEVVRGVLDIVVGIFTGKGEKIKEGFAGVWEGIKGIFSGMGGFFSGIWDTVISLFSGVGTRIGDTLSGAVKTVLNAILGFAESRINGFIEKINGLIYLVNSNPFGLSLNYFKPLSIPRLATGGMVMPGQMFIAREAGPELVGSFESRRAYHRIVFNFYM